MRFIALLRGINVGGNTVIKMAELKAVFEECGFENVVTYINSGNLAFDSDKISENTITNKLESAIENMFGKHIPVMVREQPHVHTILDGNPFAGQFGSHKEMHVLFMKDEMPADRQRQLMDNQSVDDRFVIIGREIYCHLKLGVADSLLGKGFIEKKLKVSVTARNWRTVEKLAIL